MIHVGIVGPGALGLSYASALASAGAEVTLIGRSVRTGACRVRRGFAAAREQVFATSRALVDCDVLFVALRAESVDDALIEALARTGCPVVTVSPLVSERELQRWRRVRNLVAAATHLVASVQLGERTELHYWQPPLQATTIDEHGKRFDAVIELVRLLNHGGVRTRFAPGVLERCRATTLAFFPLQQALLLRPEIASWRADRVWLRRVAAAFGVARRVARGLAPLGGPPALATWILRHSWGVWVFSLLLPSCVPQLAKFLSTHFGRKLQAQTTMFAETLSTEAALYALSPAELDVLLLANDGTP